MGKQVRQRTLLNLGRHFSLAKDEWPFLCSRIEFLLSGQKELVPQPVAAAIESLAQRYAALAALSCLGMPDILEGMLKGLGAPPGATALVGTMP
ncbi:MAG: hypothetical protein WC156_00665 [Pedobacter sp.]